MSSSPRRIIFTCSGPAGRDAQCRGGTASRRAAMVPVPVRSDRNRQSICMCRTASWRIAIRPFDFGFIKTARPFQGLPGVFPLAALTNARLQPGAVASVSAYRGLSLRQVVRRPCGSTPSGSIVSRRIPSITASTRAGTLRKSDLGSARSCRSRRRNRHPCQRAAGISRGRMCTRRALFAAPRNQSRRADHARTDRDGPGRPCVERRIPISRNSGEGHGEHIRSQSGRSHDPVRRAPLAGARSVRRSRRLCHRRPDRRAHARAADVAAALCRRVPDRARLRRRPAVRLLRISGVSERRRHRRPLRVQPAAASAARTRRAAAHPRHPGARRHRSAAIRDTSGRYAGMRTGVSSSAAT